MSDNGVRLDDRMLAPSDGTRPYATAFRLGWLVSQLHEPSSVQPDQMMSTLPAVCDMDSRDAIPVALTQLQALLDQLGPSLGAPTVASQLAAPSAKAAIAVWSSPRPTSFGETIGALHRSILSRLAVSDVALATAYSVGRGLRDTCWLAHEPADFRLLLGSSRIGVLQNGIDGIGVHLPDPAAGPAVSTSLGRWRDWVATALPVRGATWTQASQGDRVTDMLHTQGHVWYSLLSGEKRCAALLSPDAYVAAGEATLRRVGKLSRRFLAHFWPWLLSVVAVVGGLVALAVVEGQGTAKVWTSLLAVGGGLGVSWKGVQCTLGRLAQTAERSMWSLETEEASAWAATFLPPTKASQVLTRHRLRTYGIAPPRAGRGGATVA